VPQRRRKSWELSEALENRLIAGAGCRIGRCVGSCVIPPIPAGIIAAIAAVGTAVGTAVAATVASPAIVAAPSPSAAVGRIICRLQTFERQRSIPGGVFRRLAPAVAERQHDVVARNRPFVIAENEGGMPRDRRGSGTK
jgi:hypothetical protein